MLKNFSKCELGTSYQVNGKELIITRISTKTSGKCTHNIYHGTIDGEPFNDLNSPQLKRLLGVDTLQYDRGERKPSEPRRTTKRANAATWHAKANRMFSRIMAELGEDDNLRFAWVDYLNRKTNEMRHQESIEAEKRKREAAKKKMNSVELKAIKKNRIKRLNDYINSYDSRIVELMAKDMTAAQMMMLNKEERIERARVLIAVLGNAR